MAEVNGFAVSMMLDIMLKECPETRFFQAGSSEMFGHDPFCSPQNENTPFNPDNPYASSKVFAAHLVRNLPGSDGSICVRGNPLQPRVTLRRPEFVTRKITKAAAAIKMGGTKRLELGSMHPVRIELRG